MATGCGLLHINCLLRIFVVLMEKDGGIRPCDVLATCAYKVLHSTQIKTEDPGKISEGQNTQYRLFDISFYGSTD